MAICSTIKSGDWSDPTVWDTAPTSGTGDRIIIKQGHTVVYDVIGEFGDGGYYFNAGVATTTMQGMSTNGIYIQGTLKGSRTTNTELTARGMILVGLSGGLDWGTSTNPISAVTSTITLNYLTTALSGGKCGLATHASATVGYYNSMTIWGKTRNRNTYLTLSALSGSSLITVADNTGWITGDTLIIEADTTDVTRHLRTTITGITGTTMSISPSANYTRIVGTKVGNFSSNITVKSYSTTYPSFGIYYYTNLANTTVEFGHVRMQDMGWAAGINNAGGTGGTNSVPTGCLNFSLGQTNIPITIDSVIVDCTVTTSGINLQGSTPETVFVKNAAIYTTTVGCQLNSQIVAQFDDCIWYRSVTAIYPMGSFPASVVINNCRASCTSQIFGSSVNGLNIVANNCSFRSGTRICQLDGIQYLGINNSTLEYSPTVGMVNPNINAVGNIYFKNCTYKSGLISREGTNKTNPKATINVYQPNGATYDYRKLNYFYYAQTDLTTRNRGITTYRIKPEQVNTQFNVYETIPATINTPQRIKGSLRFDTNYGTSTPPSISFIGAGVSALCACAATTDVWQDFDVTLNPTSTDDITITITGKSTLSTGYVWLDGLPIYPFIQDARHYGFVFDKTSYRTINTLNTLTENQVSALAVVSNLDYLYDAATYWSVTNPASSSYIDLYTVNGTVMNFGSNNIIINNTGTGFSYNSASSTITINAPSLSAGTNFNTIKTSGTVTLSTGIISNIDINANLIQTIPTSLNGVYMLSSSNTLTYNTNTPIEIEYTNCTVVGVKNDGTALVTIKRTNSTVTESDAEVSTYAPTIINLTLQGGYAAIYDDTGTRQYYTNSNGTVVLGSTSSGSWSYKIARYGYQLISGNFTVNPSVGGTIDISPNFTPDAFITVANVSTVSGYTDLNTYDKIHDYLSYYLTTSTGINYGELDSESFGVLNFNGNLIMSGSASAIVQYTSGSNTLKLKTSTINDSIIFVVASAFTQDGGNTIGDNLKIRSSNLDSELYFNNVNSIIFYPSLSDRDNNTNAGISLSSVSIYRFKYGSTVNGITFTDYIYSRVTIDGSTLLYKTPIVAGSTTIDFGTVGNLQTILNNQRIINIGVQKASKLIPHTTNI